MVKNERFTKLAKPPQYVQLSGAGKYMARLVNHFIKDCEPSPPTEKALLLIASVSQTMKTVKPTIANFFCKSFITKYKEKKDKKRGAN